MKIKSNRRTNFTVHVLCWALYIVLWSLRDLAYYPYFQYNVLANVFTSLPLPFLVYVNLYAFIPRFLLKRRYGTYLMSLLLTIGVCLFFQVQLYDFLFNDIFQNTETGTFFTSPQGIIVILTEIILIIGISMAIFFLQEWYQKERYARELEKKQLESELAWLKHQINPHFLFNSLNTIYMLMEKNTSLAKKALEQFSDILSHQLYDTRRDHIDLEKEIEYLTSYIELAKLRHEDLLDLQCRIPKMVHPWRIAPMLLLPFVENAFKHSRSSHGYWIRIDIEIKEERLNMMISNSIPSNRTTNLSDKGGIGLLNVERRLALLYPGNFVFEKIKSATEFKVNVSIPLISRSNSSEKESVNSNKLNVS